MSLTKKTSKKCQATIKAYLDKSYYDLIVCSGLLPFDGKWNVWHDGLGKCISIKNKKLHILKSDYIFSTSLNSNAEYSFFLENASKIFFVNCHNPITIFLLDGVIHCFVDRKKVSPLHFKIKQLRLIIDYIKLDTDVFLPYTKSDEFGREFSVFIGSLPISDNLVLNKLEKQGALDKIYA